LFYCDGVTVWSKNHLVMQNGTGLLGNYSSTQSSIIVPDPANPNRYYYLFTISSGLCCGSSVSDGIRYNKIDMCANSGFGEVMTGFKNVLLTDSVTEKIAACRHSNGVDYWILTHKWKSNLFYAYLLTANGIVNTVISANGSAHSGNVGTTQGQMKISPDRTKLALGSNNTGNILDVCDFDPSTGIVSNCWSPQKPNNGNTSVYGVEFSPNSKMLYVHGLQSIGPVYGHLFQYNLASGSQSQIDSSLEMLHTYSIGVIFAPGMQLAPDGKIYFPDINNNTFLASITSPNTPGWGCGVQFQSLALAGNCFYTVPTFIADYDYSNVKVVCCQQPTLSVTATSTSGCFPYTTTVTAVSSSNFTWSTGSTQASVTLTISGAQSLSVTAIDAACISVKTVNFSGAVCNAVNDAERLAGVKVFPVPSSGELFIECDAVIDKVTIMNIAGAVVRRLSPVANSVMVSDLDPGVYSLEVRTAQHVAQKTIVVLRR
jgi:hypothetical protein